MDYAQLLQKHGWELVLVLFFLREAWPWLRDLWTNERKLKLKADADERDRKARLEERQVAAEERQATAIENVVNLTRSMDQRLVIVEGNSQTILLGITTLLERRHPPRGGD
jgi:hypothetical protein